MNTPVNTFKQSLREGRPQIGLWMGLASAYTSEICALAGFDWLLIDGEHAPNDLRTIQAQLQTIAAYPGSHAIARVPVGDTVLIKQYLDLGAQTLLVPMVDTPEQAAALVRACRYPQDDGQGASAAWPAPAPRVGDITAITSKRPTSRSACWCRWKRLRA